MRVTSLLVLLAFLLASMTPRASACVAVGAGGFLSVRGEEALIVWDDESHTEHFIRRATFDPGTRDFAFLVPTPTRPSLSEVDARVFDRLFALYRRPAPPVAPRSRARSVDGLHTSGVTVVEQSHVAGMTSTILQATSATALDGWLSEHGYPSGAAFRAWLTPYVASGWFVTAFRVDPAGGGARPVSLGAVRMSFTAERPFYPYSEPTIEGAAARPFRVSVVSATRVDAFVGSATTPWSATIGYAAHTGRLRGVLRGVLPTGAPTPAWITTFDEPRSRRGTDDLFFGPSATSEPVRSTLSTRISGL